MAARPGIKRRKTGGYQIDVYEIGTVSFARQKLKRESRFPGSIRSSNDKDALVGRHVNADSSY
jgi:hypothetical protein